LSTNASLLPVERLHQLSGEIVRWASELALAEADAFLSMFQSGIFPSADRRMLYQCVPTRFGNFESIKQPQA
jgi:hypothetical protein